MRLKKIVKILAISGSKALAVRWVYKRYLYLANGKSAFPQHRVAALRQPQLDLWSSLSKPWACDFSSQCCHKVTAKDEHFTLKQSRLHQTQDIKKEKKPKQAAECTQCPCKVSTYTQTISNQPS